MPCLLLIAQISQCVELPSPHQSHLNRQPSLRGSETTNMKLAMDKFTTDTSAVTPNLASTADFSHVGLSR
jgi:hypothetical protein